jgi:hypothetical protein
LSHRSSLHAIARTRHTTTSKEDEQRAESEQCSKKEGR